MLEWKVSFTPSLLQPPLVEVEPPPQAPRPVLGTAALPQPPHKIQKSSLTRSVLSHTSMSSMTEGCATGIYEGRGGKQRGQAGPHTARQRKTTPKQSKSSKVTPKQNQNVHSAKQPHGTHRQHRQLAPCEMADEESSEVVIRRSGLVSRGWGQGSTRS